MRIVISMQLFRTGKPVLLKTSQERIWTFKTVEAAKTMARKVSGSGGFVQSASVLVDDETVETYWNPVQERRI